MDFRTRYTFDVTKDLLGKGESARVYRAKDTLLDRMVALKFYTTNATGNFQILNEIKKAISLEHPNICKYYNVEVLSSRNIIGEEERTEVGIMEYLEAGDFKSFTAAHPEFIDKLLLDVLNGLNYLHNEGIIHRYLKPQNILIKMVNGKPVAKITDFRNSKLLNENVADLDALPATIEYIAPEQFNPKKYGINGKAATNLDLWSFGLIVYEAVNAAPLFGSRSAGVSAEQIMSNILNDDYGAKLEAVPAKYRSILKLCLVKEATKRVQSAAELISLLNDGASQSGPNVFVTQQAVHPQVIMADRTEFTAELHYQQEEQQMVPDVPESINELEIVTPDAEAAPLTDVPLPANQKRKIPEKTKSVVQPVAADADLKNSTTHTDQRLADDAGITNKSKDLTGTRNPFETSDVRAYATEDFVPARAEEPRKAAKPGKFDVREPRVPFVRKPVQASGSRKGEKPNASRKAIAIGFLLIALFTAVVLYRSDKNPDAAKAGRGAGSGLDQSLASIAPQMVEVTGGVFLMGFDGKGATEPEKPVHPVLVSDFSLGKYEVTVGEFRKFVAATGYQTTAEKEGSTYIYTNEGSRKAAVNWRYDVNGNMIDSAQANLPVVHISWYDAVAYCNWLSEKTNKKFRLPTEAEWEYATVGGKKGNIFNFNGGESLSDISWNGENAANKYHQVGGKKPNELGLFDMIGNVYEWCADWYDESAYRSGKAENPTGPNSGDKKVIRGGSWYREGGSEYYRPTIRFLLDPKERGAKVGFRVCTSNSK
jgi:formylglycine-generating enzyme required for sulfatase activity/serine/threonine protein kinase